MSQLPISFDDIAAAHGRISAVAQRTPVMTSRMANVLTGAQVFFKCENFQRSGSFKFRGAYNALLQFTAEQRQRGVVTFSSGNHAQGIALSASLLNMPSVVVMPHDAPAVKISATRAYGAEVILYDRYKEDRAAIGRKLSEERGLTFIPPFDHPHIMAGQGTLAKELIEEVGNLDVLLVPLGGGGLLSGCVTATKAMQPNCRVYGVEPQAGNDGQQSLRSGEIIHIATPDTIADGAQSQYLGVQPFSVIKDKVDDILAVEDEQLIDAMKFYANRMKLIVEPTACLSAAALFGGHLNLQGKKVGVVISGGNVDLARFASLISM
ncbi:threo-3-hydroxy-L-aspartate ammonia-lyase [Undibacterium sp. JH2W]|uniref:threo-3-hydroxy-L-aspartate ammonia-lyase n=1 Tax=Undibacterium sp. JH2W TaxID=3413037 RepID=UPI003BF451DC